MFERNAPRALRHVSVARSFFSLFTPFVDHRHECVNRYGDTAKNGATDRPVYPANAENEWRDRKCANAEADDGPCEWTPSRTIGH